jgi:hypothetical protein
LIDKINYGAGARLCRPQVKGFDRAFSLIGSNMPFSKTFLSHHVVLHRKKAYFPSKGYIGFGSRYLVCDIRDFGS